MGLVKRIGRSDTLRGLLCWLAAQYIRLVFHTCRWPTIDGDTPLGLLREGKPFIVVFWHGRILMQPEAWRSTVPFHMLISKHRDGELIARTVAHFGIRWLVGSSSKGGSQALRAMLKALKAGEVVGMTPDGPRGPRMRASSGVVNVARMAGVPVVALSFSSNPRFLTPSWDRFAVPLPFTKGIFIWGKPIPVPKDADADTIEACRLAVETELTRVTDEADRIMGVAQVEPAPPSPTHDGEEGA